MKRIDEKFMQYVRDVERTIFLVVLVLVLAALFLCVLSKAEAAELEIGAGIHRTNGAFVAVKQPIAVGRIENGVVNVMAGGWSGSRDNAFAGAEFMYTYHWLRAGVGVVYVANTNERLCTNLNFTTFLGIEAYGLGAGWRHVSNGDGIFGNNECYGHDGENLGEDWTGVQYTLEF